MRPILFAAILSLAACAGSKNYWNTYTPASGTTTQPIGKAKVAIIDAGYDIETSDDTMVASKWFQGDGLGSDDVRFRIRVSLDKGSYEVAAQCQRKSAMTSAWGDGCDPDKRPQFVIDAVSRVEAALR